MTIEEHELYLLTLPPGEVLRRLREKGAVKCDGLMIIDGGGDYMICKKTGRGVSSAELFNDCMYEEGEIRRCIYVHGIENVTED